MKRSLLIICTLCLLVPFLFWGCSGSDGSAGATGAQGPPGADGTPGAPGPGVLAKENCGTCHGTGTDLDAALVHNLNPDGSVRVAGTITVSNVTVSLGAPDDAGNRVASVSFAVAAKNNYGQAVDIDAALKTLRTGSTTDLNSLRMTLAQLVAGQTYTTGEKDPDQWVWYYGAISAIGRAKLASLSGPVGGVYTYTFPASALDPARVTRAGIQISGIPAYLFTSDPRTQASVFVNATGDLVPAGAVTKNVVALAGCRRCHDSKDSIAHGSRYDPRYCVTCHNPRLETYSPTQYPNTNLVTLVHKIHTKQRFDIDNLANPNNGIQDFSGLTYPQDIRNCTTCHAASESDANNWNTRPSIEACGSCHVNVDFATGANHIGSIQVNNSLCAVCHSPNLVVAYHADPNLTPGNVPAGLDNISYFIDNVSVNADNQPVVTFRISRNGSNWAIPVDNAGKAQTPAGFTGNGPAFQFAYALPQDGVNPPADFNNLGNGYSVPGRTQRVYLAGQPLSGSSAGYTITFTNPLAVFPSGAKMRTVTMDGYWSQTTASGNVPRHAVSQARAANGDTARRVVVDSGKCLQCHEVLEAHGGNRVNNVQNCVTCHNTTLNEGGVSLNMKDMIHGIHAASATYGKDNVTYPGRLPNCVKCHTGTTYKADLPEGVLLSTDRIVGGGLDPTTQDLVVSPTAAACGRCHNTGTAIDHYRLMGGDVGATREVADLVAPPYPLAPVVGP